MNQPDIILSKKNESYLYIEAERSILEELSNHFTFMIPNAKFNPKVRMRIWDGKIRLLRVFKTTTGTMCAGELYYGLKEELENFAKSRHFTSMFTGTSEKSKPVFSEKYAEQLFESLKISSSGKSIVSKDYQNRALAHALNVERGIILSPTSSGKSLIIYGLLRYYLANDINKILIVVPTKGLVEQLYSDFEDYSKNNGFSVEKYCHKIYSGKEKNTKKKIVITTWQSAILQDPEWFEDFSVIIGDEAHQFNAKSLTKIMTSLVNARYRFGTTGTLSDSKIDSLVLQGLFGSIFKVTTTSELMKNKDISNLNIKCLLLKYPEETCKLLKNSTYQEEIDFLIGNKKRNEFIANLAISCKGNTLILFSRVENHGKLIYDAINSKITKNRKIFFIHGGSKIEDRESVRSIVEKEKDAIIVASKGVFSVGINIRNLHNLISASPSKSKILILQGIGRSLRRSETKTEASFYDIADDLKYKNKKNYTLQHFISRLGIYIEEKFDYKIIKIPF